MDPACVALSVPRIIGRGDVLGQGDDPALGADLDPGCLELGVFVDRMQRFVPSEARLLVAAEGHRDVALVEIVDPDRTRS